MRVWLRSMRKGDLVIQIIWSSGKTLLWRTWVSASQLESYPVSAKTNRPGGANQDQAFRSVRDWSFAFRGGLAAQDNCVTQTLHEDPHRQVKTTNV